MAVPLARSKRPRRLADFRANVVTEQKVKKTTPFWLWGRRRCSSPSALLVYFWRPFPRRYFGGGKSFAVPNVVGHDTRAPPSRSSLDEAALGQRSRPSSGELHQVGPRRPSQDPDRSERK